MALLLLKRALSSCVDIAVVAPASERVITYGKYRGEKLAMLPDQYLRSMLKKPVWAESVKQVLDERLPKEGVERRPLVFTIGSRSPVKAKLVKFDFSHGITEEAVEAERIQDEMCEESLHIGGGRRRRGRSRQLLPRKGILDDLRDGESICDTQVLFPLPAPSVQSADPLEEDDDLGEPEAEQSAASAASQPTSQGMPSDGNAEACEPEEPEPTVAMLSEDEDTEEEAAGGSQALVKRYRENRRSEICDELLRMKEADRAFTLSRMQKLVDELEGDQIKLDEDSNAYLLLWCAELGDLDIGERVHRHLMKTGQSLNKQFKVLLMEMYGKCGHLENARAFFDKLPDRKTYYYGILLSAFAQHGHPQEALRLLCEMDQELGLVPNIMALESSIRACTSLRALHRGRAICELAAALRLSSNSLIGIALVEMYAACEDLDQARLAFDRIKKKNRDCYNALLAALSSLPSDALELYSRMDLEGVKPNEATHATVLGACAASPRFVRHGRQIHQRVLALGHDGDLDVSKAVVHMYGKCRDEKSAWKAFNNMKHKTKACIISWDTFAEAWSS